MLCCFSALLRELFKLRSVDDRRTRLSKVFWMACCNVHSTPQTMIWTLCERANTANRRKCVGDQFALMEGVIALAVVLKRFTFRAVPGADPGMTTGVFPP